jgi:hypothetical protein
MGLFDRLRRRIDPPQTPAPDDWVVVADVAFHDGPMVHSALEGAGIEAVLQEWTLLPGQLPSRHRILVQQRQFEVARQTLDDLRGPGLPNDPFLELE